MVISRAVVGKKIFGRQTDGVQALWKRRYPWTDYTWARLYPWTHCLTYRYCSLFLICLYLPDEDRRCSLKNTLVQKGVLG
jgi:hypothetical protein